jgi:hypothetical protein
MIDQIYDRGYQHARKTLNRDIKAAGHSLAKTVGDGLRALHRSEWNAPWEKAAQPPRSA